jgi:hypothetical protein
MVLWVFQRTSVYFLREIGHQRLVNRPDSRKVHSALLNTVSSTCSTHCVMSCSLSRGVSKRLAFSVWRLAVAVVTSSLRLVPVARARCGAPVLPSDSCLRARQSVPKLAPGSLTPHGYGGTTGAPQRARTTSAQSARPSTSQAGNSACHRPLYARRKTPDADKCHKAACMTTHNPYSIDRLFLIRITNGPFVKISIHFQPRTICTPTNIRSFNIVIYSDAGRDEPTTE